MTAVQAYNSNPTATIATYGPIADWCVSAITDMSYLFSDTDNSYSYDSDRDGWGFNADITSWETSSVTTMESMFYVRSARALPP